MSSEDTTSNDNTSANTSTPHQSRPRTKKDEIFGFPKDDVTLGIAGIGALIAGGVGVKMIWDAMQNGQLPNPFAPQQPRVTYSDIYEQQRAQQEWAARQQTQQPAITEQQARAPEVSDPNAQTMPAYNSEEFQGFDDEDDGVSYSTTVRKPQSGRFDRIHSS